MSPKSIFKAVSPTILAIILTCLTATSSVAQNLVKNPGFEDFLACPQDYGSFQKDLKSWHKPTLGSTDYFNKCGTKMNAGKNFIGRQESFEGTAYAGFYAYAPQNYREYVSGELINTMEKGKKYEFSFRISLAEKSEFAINELGVLFSPVLLNLNVKNNISVNLIKKDNHHNFIRIKSKKFLKDKNGWMEVVLEYVADGTEKFFVLGNFNSNPATDLVNVGSNLKKAAYYYLDMVSLEKTTAPFRINESFVLENVIFDTNGHKIEGKGREQLQTLVGYLKVNSTLNISIYGHTDNLGDSEYNKELSHKRAKEVGRFLVNNGLAATRISWKGFGDLAPLAQNMTKEGRSKNRRVEFLISDKKLDFYASGILAN